MTFKPKIGRANIRLAFSLVEISMVILVVGILIAGVSKGVDLYRDFVMINAKKITRNSVVPRIDNLGLWLETTLEDSFNSNFKRNEGAFVLPWKSITNDIDKVIINNGSAAWYYSNIINNLPAIITANGGFAFNQSSNFSSATIATNEGVTIFTVLKCQPYAWWNGTPMPCGSPLEVRSPTSNYKFGIAHMWGWLSFWIGRDADNSVGYGYSDQNFYSPRIMTFKADTSKLRMRIDGTEVATANVTQPINVDNQVYVRIGYSEGSSWSYRHYKGYIGEIIIYGRPLPEKQIKDVEDYLSQKWRIPIKK